MKQCSMEINIIFTKIMHKNTLSKMIKKEIECDIKIYIKL